jgi:hypothetical protein
MRTENAVGVRIVLEPAHPFAACTLDAVPEHTVKTGQDIDYTSTATIIKTKEGQSALVCGNGPSWSFGTPDDSLVWQSVEYSESIDYGGAVDARGKTKDGKYWRSDDCGGAGLPHGQDTRTVVPSAHPRRTKSHLPAVVRRLVACCA